MTMPVLDEGKLAGFKPLDEPATATRTSDYEISDEAREAYIGMLNLIDDIAIALELRARPQLVGDVVNLDDFVRQQGYDPADLAD